MSKYNVGLKTLLLQGLSEPEFYGDLVYSSTRAAENRSRWKGIVANSSVVPRRLVLKVTSRPIFVSRCITVTCLLFLWTCIRHENVMRALDIYAFF